MKYYLLDANVLLRCLLNDNPSQAKESAELLKLASKRTNLVCCIPEVTVAEVFYTLTGPRIGLPKGEAAKKIRDLLQAAKLGVLNRSYVLEALDLCENRNLPFGDAILAACIKVGNVGGDMQYEGILSFDKDFGKIKEITSLTPSQYMKENKA